MFAKVAWWCGVWSRITSSRWYRIIQIAMVGLAIGMMFRTLIASLSHITLEKLELNPGALFISLLLTWIAFYLGMFAWGEVVCALHPEVPYFRTIENHLISVFTKYLPGVGWQQVSKVVQLHFILGVPTDRAIFTVASEMGLSILTGLTVVFSILGLTQWTMLGLGSDLQMGIAVMLWLLCIFLPLAVPRFVGRQTGKNVSTKHLVLHFCLAEILDMVGWLTFGLALWFIIQAVAPLPLDTLPYCIAALVISVVIGLVIVIVPNGYGARELALYTLLQVILPVPSSVIVALLSRIVLVVAEFVGVLPIIWFIRRRTSHT